MARPCECRRGRGLAGWLHNQHLPELVALPMLSPSRRPSAQPSNPIALVLPIIAHPPFCKLGSRSFWILSPMAALPWPVSPRFHVKTTHSTSGASTSWLRDTWMRGAETRREGGKREWE